MPTSSSGGAAADNLLAVSRPRACPPNPVRTEFDPDVEPSMTKQAHAGECDINQILARYQRTGLIDHFARHGGDYGEVPAIDFQEAVETVRQTTEMFNELPSNIRNRFNESPAEFLAFVQNSDNLPEMAALGLIEPPRSPTIAAPPIDAPEPSGDGS